MLESPLLFEFESHQEIDRKMRKTTRHHLLVSLLAASAIAGLSTTALAATSSANTTFNLSVSFFDAIFSGGPSAGSSATEWSDFEVDPGGYWITSANTFLNTGVGTVSNNASMTAGGTAPDVFDEFPYTSADTIDMQLAASASASGGGSSYITSVDGGAYIAFQSYSDDDLLLTFGFNWTRSIDASNEITGSHAVGLLDANASAERGSGDMEIFQFIDGNAGYNIGTSVTTPFNFNDGDTGLITLTLPANDYLVVSFNVTTGAFAQVAAVPEADSWAMMLAGLGLIGAIGRRKLNKAA